MERTEEAEARDGRSEIEVTVGSRKYRGNLVFCWVECHVSVTWLVLRALRLARFTVALRARSLNSAAEFSGRKYMQLNADRSVMKSW